MTIPLSMALQVREALKEAELALDVVEIATANAVQCTDEIAKLRTARRTADALVEALGWRDISTAPKEETEPFLVLLPGNDVCKALAVQVSNFEGRMYPDCKDGIIDWEDAIMGATHWMALPKPLHKEGK